MPQLQLPIFPDGVNEITRELGFIRREGKVTYFYGQLPVFGHDEKDIQTFRMITSQFIAQGVVKPAVISKAFGVPIRTVKRYASLYRKEGVKGFYKKKKHRGANVLTRETIEEAQLLLDEGYGLKEIGSRLNVKTNTLNKAVHSGRLYRQADKKKVLEMF